MFQLNKMLIINWHYISKEMIEFKKINFLTGKNAAGKSTIIDAIQVILLGSTNGACFNKAANDKAGRTIEGYLRGEMGDDGNTGFKCLRNGKFSSYIALEFLDTIKKTYFTLGIVFDTYKDKGHDNMFFYINGAIPECEFIQQDNYAMNIAELKSFLARTYKSKYNTFISNKEYQKFMLNRFGSLDERFLNLFKKAVTFTPIDNIERFISEYVCDISSVIDISKMQESLRQYKSLEKQVEIMKIRISKLEEIREKYNKYIDEKNKEKLQEYMIDKAREQAELNALNGLIQEKEKKTKMVSELTQREVVLNEEIEKLSKEYNELNESKLASDVYLRLKNLEEEIVVLDEKLQELKSILNKNLRHLKNSATIWEKSLDRFEKIIHNEEINDDIMNSYMSLKDDARYIISLDEESIINLDIERLEATKNKLNKMINYANDMYYLNESKRLKNEKEKTELKDEVTNLKNGIKAYRPELVEFKEILKNNLQEKFNENIQIDILADLLEINDAKWVNAVEGYLNTQRFYIIIDPKYYIEASRIYKELTKNNKYHSIGIVDVGKIKENNRNEPEKSSLAEVITTQNEYAKTYINYLLGKVIRCENVENLREFKTAITAECLLYQNYVLRKIDEKIYNIPFLGKKSIERQIEIKTKKVEIVEAELVKIIEALEVYVNIKTIENLTSNEIEGIKLDIIKIGSINSIISQKTAKEKERDERSSDIAWINTVDERLKNLDTRISTLKTDKERNHDKITENNTNIHMYETVMIPEQKEKSDYITVMLYSKYDKEFIENIGNVKFNEEIKNKYAINIENNYKNQIERTRKLVSERFNSLAEKRKEYNTSFQMSYDYYNKLNDDFDKELHRLNDSEISKYQTQITDSRKKAYEQFREDFISKLKANIDSVNSSVKAINEALKMSNFGNDTYSFKVTSKQEYKRFYDMITDTMLMEGNSLTSEVFNTKYKEEINDLFSRIISEDSLNTLEEKEAYEKNIRIYTDYRTYLNFDLIVKDQSGNEQRLSKTLEKKSGGETQTPFYIAVLASFAQIYKIRIENKIDTLRLIVFDEAFSKMDGERIEESIKLLKKFGLQAILVAPSEKIADIAPLVDKTLCVIREGTQTIVKEFDMKEENFV